MTLHDPSKPMWAHVLGMLDQADKLQRQYFQLRKSGQSGPTWEPPVDVYETKNELLISVALPGVPPDDVRIIIENGMVAIIGERSLPVGANAIIRRMEIPYGRFERRISLKNGHFEIREKSLANGCLKLALKKSDAGET